jgi:acyl-ACP thioesterase
MQTMENSLEQAFQIRSYHIDADKKLKASSLLGFLQETAGLHANALHFGMSDLKKSNHTWVLSRMYFEMDRWPKLGEVVTIETWPRGIERLFAIRDFLIHDGHQDQIGRASSYWLIVDRSSRRPQSPAHLDGHQSLTDRRATNRRLDKIKSLDKLESMDSRRSYYTDMDMNGHVNNVRYSDWIQDSMPQEIQVGAILRSMEFNYLSEIVSGQEVVVRLSPFEDNTIHASIAMKNSGKEACRAVCHFF